MDKSKTKYNIYDINFSEFMIERINEKEDNIINVTGIYHEYALYKTPPEILLKFGFKIVVI